MHIGRIVGATRDLGAPADWDPEKHGTCDTLPILDLQDEHGVNRMVSAWLPTPEEIAALAAGAPIFLSVLGIQHPPVMLSVGIPPAEPEASNG